MKMNLAERELSAFFAAVETLFGPEQAKLSAEDWLDAAEQVLGPNETNSRDCRGLTIIAASRLAHRLGLRAVEQMPDFPAMFCLVNGKSRKLDSLTFSNPLAPKEL